MSDTVQMHSPYLRPQRVRPPEDIADDLRALSEAAQRLSEAFTAAAVLPRDKPLPEEFAAQLAAALGPYAEALGRVDPKDWLDVVDTLFMPRKGPMMAKKPPIHTAPDGDDWINRREGSSRPFGTYRTKAEAERAGRAAAKRDRTEHKIHNKKGQITESNSYGNDPYPPRG